MTNPVMVVRGVVARTDDAPDPADPDDPTHWRPAGRACWVWCPGCDGVHRVAVDGADGTAPTGPRWDWDGNEEAPTFGPSILVHGTPRCHSYIEAGRWRFLGDCEHPLAGQTVDMVPVPDWLVR